MKHWTQDEFLKKLREKNTHYRENKFEIVSDYKGIKSIIKIKYDKLYFNIMASTLLGEWLPTVITAVDKGTFWLQKFEKVRRDFNSIDYSNMKYSGNKSNVNFKCKIHNLHYSQRVDHHYNNVQGCIKCMQYPIIYNEDTIVKHKDFLEQIDGFLYVIKLESEKESFYKVGITGENRINYRFSELEKYYKINFEYLQNGNMVELFKLEQMFLKEFKGLQYSPQIKFRGHTECLTTNPVAEYYHWYYNK